MNLPALNRSELVGKLFLRLLVVAGVMVFVGFVFFPAYSASLFYGALIFLISNLVFGLYVFRFSGARSSLLMLQSFGRGVFFKMVLFALALALLYRFDEQSRTYAQSAAILGAFFVLQAAQIMWSITLFKDI